LLTTAMLHPGDSDSIEVIPKGTKIISIREMNILPKTNAIVFLQGQDPLQVTDWKGNESFANIDRHSEGADAMDLACALRIIPSTEDRLLPNNFEVIEGNEWFTRKPQPIDVFTINHGVERYKTALRGNPLAYLPKDGIKAGSYLYIPSFPGVTFWTSSTSKEVDREFKAPFEEFTCARRIPGLREVPDEKLSGLFLSPWEEILSCMPEEHRNLAYGSAFDRYRILVPASQNDLWEPSDYSTPEITIGELKELISSSFELKFPPPRVIGE